MMKFYYNENFSDLNILTTQPLLSALSSLRGPKSHPRAGIFRYKTGTALLHETINIDYERDLFGGEGGIRTASNC